MPASDIVEASARKACRENDYAGAIKVLMNGYGDHILRYCRLYLNDDEDARDTCQVTFIQGFRSLPEFRQGATFWTWLHAIARHKCFDLSKKHRRFHARISFTDEPPDDADDSAERDIDHDVQAVLEHCLGKMAENIRETMLMHYCLGYSYREVADISDEKQGTLQARVARALPALRQCVERHGVEL